MGQAKDERSLSFNDFQKLDSIRYFVERIPEKSLEFIQQLNEPKISDTKTELEILNLTATAYKNLGDINQAIKYFELTYHKSEDLGNKEYEIKALRSLGNLYRQIDDTEHALLLFEQVLKLIKDEAKLTAKQYLILSDTYKEIKEYNNAIEYALNAIDYYSNLEDIEGIADGYNMLGSIYWNKSNFKKAIENYEKALEYRISLNDINLIASSYINIGVSYKSIGDFQNAKDYFGLALEIYQKNNNYINLGNIYNHIGSLYWSIEEPNEALMNYYKSLHYREIVGNSRLIASSFQNIGNTYRSLLKYDSALYYHNEALDLRKQIEIQSDIAAAYNYIGNIYWHTKSYSDALAFQFSALKIYEKLQDLDGQANTFKNIGLIYKNLENYDKAIEFINKSSKIDNERNNQINYASNLNYIGSLYYDQKNYDKALDYYTKSAIIRTDIGNKLQMQVSYSNIGNTYAKLGENKKAIKNYRTALQLNFDINNHKRIAYVYHQIGNFYKSINQQDSSLFYYNQALTKAWDINYNYIGAICARKLAEYHLEKKQINVAEKLILESLDLSRNLKELEFKQNAYFILYEINELRENTNQALLYYKLYSEIKDTLLKQKYNEEIFNTQLSIEMEKNKTEVDKFVKEIDEIKKEKRTQVVIKYYLLISIILVLVILVLYINRLRLKKKSEQLLQSKINEINAINKRLVLSEKQLLETNRSKDKFFSILAHDLRNPFNGLMGISKLLEDNINKIDIDDIKRYAGIINHTTKQIYSLLENLLEWSLTQMGHITYEPIQFKISELAEKNIELVKVNSEKKNLTITSKISDKTVVFADKNTINTVIRNLLTNAIKYSNNNGHIIIAAETSTENVIISVTDNGIGISEENIKKLFILEEQISTKGTLQETGSGLGLILCEEFVRKNNGKIWVESVENKKTSFFFTLPLK